MPGARLPPFALKLRALRHARRLTQKRLAELAGLSVARVAIIEQGQWPKRNYLDTLRKLASALGVQLAELDEDLAG
ncbi:MAG TPA: helix-turn-helix transcriptional regulator [Gemmataceae bacterium]|jgi:transcriptional regulator with XRE-family HTH domain|nr:helix-turn-helix transcriptional regulator [Gemmataceae bacterium]